MILSSVWSDVEITLKGLNEVDHSGCHPEEKKRVREKVREEGQVCAV